MSSRRSRSPPAARLAPSARGSTRGSARGSRRQQAQTSEDEDDRVPQREIGIRRKIRRVVDRMTHANLINAVEYLASAELNHVESSMAITKVLEVALAVGEQYEELVRDQNAELLELRAKVSELEKDSDDRTIILDDDQGRVFAPSIRKREGDGGSGRGSARGVVAPPPSARSVISPAWQPAPAASAPVASILQAGVLPYPVGSRLPERGPGKQYTVLILHYLASAVPIEAVVDWCRAEQHLLKEWIVGMDDGRGEVIVAVRYAGRKMAVGSFTFRIGNDLPSVAVVPPPRQQDDAINYVRGLGGAASWNGSDDISEGEAR